MAARPAALAACALACWLAAAHAQDDVDVAAAHHEDASVVNLTDASFDAAVAGAPRGWLIKFYAPWCRHCRDLAPHFDAAAAAVGDAASFGRVDCDESGALCKRFGVPGYPSLYWVPPGTPQDAVVSAAVPYKGRRNAAAIAAWVRRAVEPPVADLAASDAAGGPLQLLGDWAAHHGAERVAFVALEPPAAGGEGADAASTTSSLGAAFATAAARLYLGPPAGVAFAVAPAGTAARLAAQLAAEVGRECACVRAALEGGGSGSSSAAAASTAPLLVARVEASVHSRGALATAAALPPLAGGVASFPPLHHVALDVLAVGGSGSGSGSSGTTCSCATEAGPSGGPGVTVTLTTAAAPSGGAGPAAVVEAWVAARTAASLPRASSSSLQHLLQDARRDGRLLALAVVDGADVAAAFAERAASAAAPAQVGAEAAAGASSRRLFPIGFGHLFQPDGNATGEGSGASVPAPPPPSLPFLSAVRAMAREAAAAANGAGEVAAGAHARLLSPAAAKRFRFATLDVAASPVRYRSFLSQFDVLDSKGAGKTVSSHAGGRGSGAAGGTGEDDGFANGAFDDGYDDDGGYYGDEDGGAFPADGEDDWDGAADAGVEEGEPLDCAVADDGHFDDDGVWIDGDGSAGDVTVNPDAGVGAGDVTPPVEAAARSARFSGGAGRPAATARVAAPFRPRLLVLDPASGAFYTDAAVAEAEEVATFLGEVAAGHAPAQRANVVDGAGGAYAFPPLDMGGLTGWAAAVVRALASPPLVRRAFFAVGLGRIPAVLQALIVAEFTALGALLFGWAAWALVLRELLHPSPPAVPTEVLLRRAMAAAAVAAQARAVVAAAAQAAADGSDDGGGEQARPHLHEEEEAASSQQHKQRGRVEEDEGDDGDGQQEQYEEDDGEPPSMLPPPPPPPTRASALSLAESAFSASPPLSGGGSPGAGGSSSSSGGRARRGSLSRANSAGSR